MSEPLFAFLIAHKQVAAALDGAQRPLLQPAAAPTLFAPCALRCSKRELI